MEKRTGAWWERRSLIMSVAAKRSRIFVLKALNWKRNSVPPLHCQWRLSKLKADEWNFEVVFIPAANLKQKAPWPNLTCQMERFPNLMDLIHISIWKGAHWKCLEMAAPFKQKNMQGDIKGGGKNLLFFVFYCHLSHFVTEQRFLLGRGATLDTHHRGDPVPNMAFN